LSLSLSLFFTSLFCRYNHGKRLLCILWNFEASIGISPTSKGWSPWILRNLLLLFSIFWVV
jgi:hypothetical protein